MIDLTPQDFGARAAMREFFLTQPACRMVRLAKNELLYFSGQKDPTVYFVVSGRIKLILPSVDGKECLLAVRTEGELVGEWSTAGLSDRIETAVGMNDSLLKQISCKGFLEGLRRASLLEHLIRYLAVRNSEQQEVIATLATVNSEQRLAKTLLYLSRILGAKDPAGMEIRHRFSHEELSEMVGTTRSRISIFLKKFRNLGLIAATEGRCLVVVEGKSREYLDCLSCPAISCNHPFCPAQSERRKTIHRRELIRIPDDRGGCDSHPGRYPPPGSSRRS